MEWHLCIGNVHGLFAVWRTRDRDGSVCIRPEGLDAQLLDTAIVGVGLPLTALAVEHLHGLVGLEYDAAVFALPGVLASLRSGEVVSDIGMDGAAEALV